jgi:hypothetical protein
MHACQTSTDCLLVTTAPVRGSALFMPAVVVSCLGDGCHPSTFPRPATVSAGCWSVVDGLPWSATTPRSVEAGDGYRQPCLLLHRAIADHPKSGRVPFEKRPGGAPSAIECGLDMAWRHPQTPFPQPQSCCVRLNIPEQSCNVMKTRHMRASRRLVFRSRERHI